MHISNALATYHHVKIFICNFLHKNFFSASHFSGIGVGAVRANLIIFGADQIRDSITTSTYFDKCVVVVHLSVIIEILAAVYIPQTADLFLYFLFENLMLLLAIVSFLVGWRWYIHVTPYDSVLSNVIPVVSNALQTWRQVRRHTITSPLEEFNASNSFTSEEGRGEVPINTEKRLSTFLDFAKVVNHGKFPERVVDDVKLFRGALVILILVLPYRLVYNQVKSMRFSSFFEHFILFLLALFNIY